MQWINLAVLPYDVFEQISMAGILHLQYYTPMLKPKLKATRAHTKKKKRAFTRG